MNITLRARALAKHHIQREVDAGLSKRHISSTWSHSSSPKHLGGEFGSYDVSIGGVINGRRLPPTKIIVHRVNGVQADIVFSLSDIYEECQLGQQQLFYC